MSLQVDSEQSSLRSLFTPRTVKSTCWELSRVRRPDFENDPRSLLALELRLSETAVLHYSCREYVSVDLVLFVISLQVCPNGYLSLESGAGCRACPDGYSCDPRSGVLRSCGPGQYSPEGESECQECPERYICPDGQSRQVQNGHVILQGQIFILPDRQGLNVNVLSREKRLPWFNSRYGPFFIEEKHSKHFSGIVDLRPSTSGLY